MKLPSAAGKGLSNFKSLDSPSCNLFRLPIIWFLALPFLVDLNMVYNLSNDSIVGSFLSKLSVPYNR